ncbi:histidine kinase [Halalkalibacter okhensis]|uniref:histidine kinase n=1 Tax=Halalkalibacter okhensis TaxID=333138 RepID=A0A0B0IH20_9BACI|nr:histidine kinase [Halalkalibacter okhensis]
MNILMVDDHPENLLALEAVLTSPNYNLVSATSGKQALKYMLKQDFAVILLDVQMPGLNGFETAKLIKMREKTKNIPIIFITAISQDVEHVQQGYSVGAIDYIFKPYEPELLKQKIEQFVKIHQNHEEQMIQNEAEKTAEIQEINEKLDLTTLDLRKSEALAKVIGDTILDTIVTFDTNGNIVSVNKAITNMFGYSFEEIVKHPIESLFLKGLEDSGTYTWPFHNSFTEQVGGRVVEVIAIRKDSSQFPADIQIGETTVDGQEIYVCTIRDITERKQMEEVKKQKYINLESIVQERTMELLLANEKLKNEVVERKKIAAHLLASQERFRKMFESSPSLIAIYSLEDKTFIDVNERWVDYTGYSYEELNTINLRLLYCIEEMNIDCLDLRTSNRNQKISYKTKNGQVRSGLLSTELITLHSKPCALIVVTDITDRVLLENEMARLDRLNLIGEMAAGIAHEIRNPMTTVHGFLQVAKSSREHLKIEIVDLMLDELNRANSIITEFLNLAKNKVSDKRSQSLNKIIKSLFPLIQAEALRSSKEAVLDTRDCPDIYLDEKEIRQIILNIALNGLDAMTSGGVLVIRTYTENKEVVLEIQDEGEGISPEIIEKIGTPFFTTKEDGTGLGLAICYSVAERHQAEIDITTGKTGTIFSIRFNL